MPIARPFAYNPSQTPIAGATQSGNLAIATQTLDWNSTGLSWWMGPDEENAYIVAAPYPAGDFPTPIGNVGTVSFWSSPKTDSAFIALARQLLGSSYASASLASDALFTAGYWTSFTAVDQIRAQLTVAQQTTYDSTATGNWIKVTSTQYNNIFNNVAGATKKGNSDLQISTRDVLTGSANRHIAFGTGTTPSFQIDTGEYVIAMITEAWNQTGGSSQLGYTTSFTGASITNVGSTAGPSTGGVRDYFVRKAPTDPATETRYPTLFMTVSSNAVANWPGYNSTNSGTTWTVNLGNSTSKIQLVTTSTRSW